MRTNVLNAARAAAEEISEFLTTGAHHSTAEGQSAITAILLKHFDHNRNSERQSSDSLYLLGLPPTIELLQRVCNRHNQTQRS
jgi:hypothetical protein